jgi:peptidase E
LEITLRLRRDEEGKITEGELSDYVKVGSGNTFDAWQQWYRENASEWDEIADIEGELGRDGP